VGPVRNWTYRIGGRFEGDDSPWDTIEVFFYLIYREFSRYLGLFDLLISDRVVLCFVAFFFFFFLFFSFFCRFYGARGGLIS